MKAAFDLAGSLNSTASPDCRNLVKLVGFGNGPKPLPVQEKEQRSEHSALVEVQQYYASKTDAILQRYGPGPRVHYHAGLMDEAGNLDAPASILRARLVRAQEDVLCHAAEVWHAPSTLYGDVLDVGCGLGGGAIFWAQEFGARVTAVTCVPSHASLVEQFAMQAGVEDKIKTVVADALEVPGQDCFDAVVAFDSSCHLLRREWFNRLFELLRPGGQVFISDCFFADQEYAEPFDQYWHTRIGSIAEYMEAAQQAGLRSEIIEDLTSRIEHFWTVTLALMRAEAKESGGAGVQSAKRATSVQAHRLLEEGLHSFGLRYALLSFSKGY